MVADINADAAAEIARDIGGIAQEVDVASAASRRPSRGSGDDAAAAGSACGDAS